MSAGKRKPQGTTRTATAGTAADNSVAAVRHFNRFYTRQIGVLRKTYLDSPYSLGEARVLYEIARQGAPTASDVSRALDLDAGYLSRVIRNFESRGLIQRRVSASDARQSHLTLTSAGKKAFTPLDARSQHDTGTMLGKLKPADQKRLIAAMTTIQTLLGDTAADNKRSDDTTAAPAGPAYALRAPRPGDFGWMVKRHAELYFQEYQWSEPFEGLCAQIIADFANNHDPKRERCWIAEMNGENVGCIFLAKDSDTVARIRLLLVDPKARGLKLGARLVDECIGFARKAGYKKITLWTHSVLTAARHIYQQRGFALTRTEKHKSWGRPVVSEHWDLEL